jgi:hypothetical protein
VPQPDFVPMTRADEVRAAERMPVPDGWVPDRPGEVVTKGGPPQGRRFGATGPDQGFGLKLARLVADRAVLPAGEHREDAVAGCLTVGLKRAARFGRAPVIYDMELAFTIWGYLGGASAELIAFRRALFAGSSHDYWAQRGIADRVPDETLRLTPDQAAARLAEWRILVDAS